MIPEGQTGAPEGERGSGARAVGAEFVEEMAGGDAGGPARAARLDARPGAGIGERGFVSETDPPRRDKRPVSRDLRPQRREVEVVPRRRHRAFSAPRPRRCGRAWPDCRASASRPA